jgi:hypothetical protein
MWNVCASSAGAFGMTPFTTRSPDHVWRASFLSTGSIHMTQASGVDTSGVWLIG